MRGLLCTGGGIPRMTEARNFFGEYSFVVAADSGLEAAIAADLCPNLIVGDMDSLSDPSLLDRFPDAKKEVWPRDKDYTDTELGLRAMESAGIEDIVMIGGSGGRMDHLLALRTLFDRNPSPSLWIGQESVIALLGADCACRSVSLQNAGPEMPVSVFPAGSGPWSCRSTGLLWDLSQVQWDAGAYSLSNRTVSGSCTVTASRGRFLLVFPLDGRISLIRDCPLAP